MTPATRLRLLEVWRKVPETRPDGLEFSSVGMFWLHDSAIPEGFAVLAVCGKLCEWLRCIEIVQMKLGDWFVSEYGYDGKTLGRGPTLLDALLAAAEAVAGETKGT